MCDHPMTSASIMLYDIYDITLILSLSLKYKNKNKNKREIKFTVFNSNTDVHWLLALDFWVKKKVFIKAQFFYTI